MEIKELSNEKLIKLFKENNFSLQAIEHKYNLSKNSVGRLFNKRGINYKQIKEEELKYIQQEYELNPKLCKNCGKPIPFNERNKKDFCNQSCSTTYNNFQRNNKTQINKISTNYCLNCNAILQNNTNSSKKKYCNNKCQREYKYKQYIFSWKNGLKDGRSGQYETSNYIRKYLFDKYNNSCQNCGWHEINPATGLVPLQIHHIDGNCINNTEDNLQLLCPNCHSLTKTFGSLNKKSSRIFRKQKGSL